MEEKTTMLTDSNNVWEELPKMNEKPSTTVARGTSEEMPRWKISSPMKMTRRRATQRSTPSSFATIEPTSWKGISICDTNGLP